LKGFIGAEGFAQVKEKLEQGKAVSVRGSVQRSRLEQRGGEATGPKTKSFPKFGGGEKKIIRGCARRYESLDKLEPFVKAGEKRGTRQRKSSGKGAASTKRFSGSGPETKREKQKGRWKKQRSGTIQRRNTRKRGPYFLWKQRGGNLAMSNRRSVRKKSRIS